MGEVFNVGAVRDALRKAEHVDYWWQDGKIRLGAPPGGCPVGQQLRVVRTEKGVGALVGVLRIMLEPVIFMDSTAKGGEARVHMFRYQDASGAAWLWSFCGSCGACGNRPDVGYPMLEECCGYCGCVRSAVECRGWHTYGECPECGVTADLPVLEPEGPSIAQAAAMWRARRDGVKVAEPLVGAKVGA